MLKAIASENSVLALALCIAIAAWVTAKMRAAIPAITDSSGLRMKTLAGDTRVRRFSHGFELSNEGFNMAGGSPYLIQNGTRREVVLCRPEHLREFHRGDSKEHWKAPDGNMGYFFHRLLGECVGAQSGSEWTNIRSLFDPIYTTAAMSKYISTFRKEVQLWLDSLPGHGSVGDTDAPFFAANISDKCGVLPLKLVAMTLYGAALSHELFEDLLELSKLREEVGSNAFMSMSVISRIYAFLPTKANRQLDKYIAGFRNFNNQIAETAKQLNLECPLGDIIRQAHCGKIISMQQFLHTVDEILFENLDVAASALSCLLLNMACDMASQEDVRREARLAVGMLKADATVEAYLDRSDTYLEQCCAESRRLCPSIWFTFCERSPNPKVIGGFEVPANTDVTVDWRRISLESPIWSLSLDEGQREITGYDFVPRRYDHISKADTRYSQVAYGPGARRCLGQHFANLLMRLVLFEVLTRYRISATEKPWEVGFRRDKFVLTPKAHVIRFDRL